VLPQAPAQSPEGLRFARRMYLPRAAGLAFGCFAIASVFWQQGASTPVWAALAFNALLWPHVAYLIAANSRNPRRAELRNLIFDSACGGAWIALMKFNVLPSVMLAVMLSMDKVSVGGTRLLARSASAMFAAALLAGALTGFEVRLETSMLTIFACLPLLVSYPMIVGFVTYRLSRRVREQNQRLAELGRTDGLSGVPNRAYWEEAVEREFQRHARHGGPACLLMLDIDHFKAINDRYGHTVGDDVIRGVAEVLRDCVRGQDTVGRYGGEEFGVVLPETSLEGAAAIAERIRRRVEGAALAREGVRCTASIGIAEATAKLESRIQWINSADQALYKAKANGRNRVERAA
jgi:diguanylate cyclase